MRGAGEAARPAGRVSSQLTVVFAADSPYHLQCPQAPMAAPCRARFRHTELAHQSDISAAQTGAFAGDWTARC